MSLKDNLQDIKAYIADYKHITKHQGTCEEVMAMFSEKRTLVAWVFDPIYKFLIRNTPSCWEWEESNK